jgi:bifunctional non-homologous end joining protein LigD
MRVAKTIDELFAGIKPAAHERREESSAAKAPKRSQTRFKARMIEGARAEPKMPSFIEPMKPTLMPEPPAGNKWLHEIKFDGYRTQAHMNAQGVKIYTSNGNNITERFASIAKDVARLPAERLILDGEAVVQDDEGRPSFAKMHSRAKKSAGEHLVYYVFDILYFDGFDLRDSPLIERKRILKELFTEAGNTGAMFYSEHFEEEGAQIFALAESKGLEGIVSKLPESRYRSGTSKSWLKARTTQKGDFPIVGFIPAAGGHVAALYIGEREGRAIKYAGKVGTGFSNEVSHKLRDKLERIATRNSPLGPKVKKPHARWVAPVLQAHVEYKERQPSGTLRHPSFKGLKE